MAALMGYDLGAEHGFIDKLFIVFVLVTVAEGMAIRKSRYQTIAAFLVNYATPCPTAACQILYHCSCSMVIFRALTALR